MRTRAGVTAGVALLSVLAGVDLPMLTTHLGAILGTLWLLHAAGRCREQLVSALGLAGLVLGLCRRAAPASS
jgi:hypothetical protein